MHTRRYLLHGVIVGYVLITTLAFVFTMTGWRSSLAWPLVKFSYGMMAPYQGYETYQQELLVEGQREDGTWETIDMATYWPFLRGERVVRGWLWSFRDRLPEAQWKAKYQALGRHLMRLEAQAGREYQAVRFYWQTWPPDPRGYYAMRTEPHVQSEFITQVP